MDYQAKKGPRGQLVDRVQNLSLPPSSVLRKNAVRTFESCQISSNKMFIFEESCEYFHLKLSDNLDLALNKILWKFEGEMFTGFLDNPYFIEGNLSTSEGSYGVFP